MSNPYEAPITLSSPSAEIGNPLSEGTIFKCWLIFFLMATVLGFCIGMVVGIIVGTVLVANGGNASQVQGWSTVIGFFVGMPVSYICFRFCIKRYVIEPMIVAARVRKIEVPE